MQESTAYDEVMNEGPDRGRLEGETRGRLEGEIRSKVRLLLRLGRKQIGNPDAATEAALSAITDLDRLERLGDAVLTAKTWSELLGTP